MKDKDRKRIAALEEATCRAAAEAAAKKYPDHLLSKTGALEFANDLVAVIRANVTDPDTLAKIRRGVDDIGRKYKLRAERAAEGQ